MLNSPDLGPYSKLEYLEREIRALTKEDDHLNWLKRLTQEEKEWLIKQDIDKLLKLNWQTLLKAREHIKRQYLNIRNNVESIVPEDLDLRKRYDSEQEEGKRET